jgi:hypothetical protein
MNWKHVEASGPRIIKILFPYLRLSTEYHERVSAEIWTEYPQFESLEHYLTTTPGVISFLTNQELYQKLRFIHDTYRKQVSCGIVVWRLLLIILIFVTIF